MFGYILPDRAQMADEEFALFNAFYCGICKQIGLKYGQIRRFTTNYDITFFAALMFDQLDFPVEIDEQRCIGNPQKKATVKPSTLLEKIADLNMIFCFYKAEDNVIDGGGSGAKAARNYLRKSWAIAAKAQPVLDQIVNDGYQKLRHLEQQNEKSIDRVSDCFATLMKDCAASILGTRANENSLNLVYNTGKFVYLADALDDTGEDSKSSRFNPFLAALGNFTTRQEFFKTHEKTISFIMATTVNRAIECFNDTQFFQSYSMLKNIVHLGLRKKTAELLSSKSKLKKPKI